MGLFNSIRMGSSAAEDAYEIERSLRFNDDDSAYLSRTPSSAGNKRTFTISLWTKRANLTGALFGSYISDADRATLRFSSDNLEFQSAGASVKTNAVFRDPNAWYHIVCAIDTTEGTQSNRGKLYVNGVQQDLSSNNFSQNVETSVNNNSTHVLGTRWVSGSANSLYDGYLAEVHLIDGSALTPSSFGETDAITGQWIPKEFDSSVIPNKSSRTFSSSGWTLSASGWSGSKPITNAYNGSIGTSNSDVANNNAGGVTATWDTSSYNLTGNLRIFCWSDGGEYDIYVNGNATKVADTPSGSGNAAWVDCGTHTNINEIQFAGTSYNSSTGLGASGFYIAGFMVNGTLLKDTTPEFGTNGFHLNFSDNSGTTSTTLGKDSSGNSNNFTPNNVVTGDAVKDSPTNNFCNFNGMLPTAQTTLAEGNLKMTVVDSHKTVYGTHGLKSGKWYWEGLAIAGSSTKWTYGVSDIENSRNTQTTNNNMLLGVEPAANYAYGDAVSIYKDDLYKNGTKVTDGYQTTSSGGDIIGIALDVDAGKVWFARNGTWINGSASASTTLDTSNHDTTVTTGKVYTPAFSAENVSWQANFGQDSSFSNAKTAQGNTDGSGKGDFYYAVPSGFKAICSANLPDSTIKLPNKHFDTLLYSGTGSSQSITGLEFQPDWVWIKKRNGAENHELQDAVRGATKRLASNTDDVESTVSGSINAFNSDGFTVVDAGTTNENGNTYAAWNWKGGGSASSNGDGSLTSSVSANTTAGFSIVSWTSTGTTGSTIGHGLGVKPDVIILKGRNTSDAQPWRVYHHDLGATKSLMLDSNAVPATQTGVWNDTEPTSSVFTVGSFGSTNENTKNYIAYCFNGVAGYSKFGEYTGNNNSDGTFVYTGFQPAYLVIRKTNLASNWIQWDNARMTYNVMETVFELDGNDAESGSSNTAVDFLSNGFKFRNNYTKVNGDGDTYIYMAFAEAPYKYSRAR